VNKQAADAMQKDLYDTAGFWKYMRRVKHSPSPAWFLEATIERLKGHLARLEEILEETQFQVTVDEEIARREA